MKELAAINFASKKNKEDMEKRFEHYSEREGNAWGFNWRARQLRRYEIVLKSLLSLSSTKGGDKHERKILEIGCATGDFTLLLTDANSKAYLTGVDIAENAIAICKNRIDNKRCNFLPGSFPHFDFPNEYFDEVVCMSVINYFDFDFQKQCMDEMIRLASKTGGILIEIPLETLNPQNIIDYLNKLFNKITVSYIPHKLYARLFEPFFWICYVSLWKNRKLGYFGLPFGYFAKMILKSKILVRVFEFFNRMVCPDFVTHIVISLDMKDKKI